jgi:hypothetical protein
MSPWEACFYAGSPMTDLSQTDCKVYTRLDGYPHGHSGRREGRPGYPQRFGNRRHGIARNLPAPTPPEPSQCCADLQVSRPEFIESRAHVSLRKRQARQYLSERPDRTRSSMPCILIESSSGMALVFPPAKGFFLVPLSESTTAAGQLFNPPWTLNPRKTGSPAASTPNFPATSGPHTPSGKSPAAATPAQPYRRNPPNPPAKTGT